MPSLTITTTAQQAQRLATAFGEYFTLKDAQGVVRPATEAEIKAWIILQLRALVIRQERKAQEDLIVDSPFDPT